MKARKAGWRGEIQPNKETIAFQSRTHGQARSSWWLDAAHFYENAHQEADRMRTSFMANAITPLRRLTPEPD